MLDYTPRGTDGAEQLSMSDHSLQTLRSPPDTHGLAPTAPAKPPDEQFHLVRYPLQPFILSPLAIPRHVRTHNKQVLNLHPSAFFNLIILSPPP